MAKKYLDYDGLLYFWGKIKAYVDSHSGGGGGGVTDVQMNGSSVVTGGVAKITDNSGNMSLDGDLTIGGHSSPVGTDIAYTANSVTSVQSATTLGYIDIPAGVWDIRAYVTFAGKTGADGYRRASIATSEDSMPTQGFGIDGKYVEGNIIIVCMPVRVVTLTSTTRYYLNASASATITISNRSMRAVRIA